MPRGGRRQGTPGTAYSNRSDLQRPKLMALPGQGYGVQKAQVDAQRAVPMARPASDSVRASTSGVPASGSLGGTGAPGLMPGQVTPLDAPTQRPGEPITAGMDIGAGPGREALGPYGGGGEDVASQLRAIYTRFPNEDLRALLETIDDDD